MERSKTKTWSATLTIKPFLKTREEMLAELKNAIKAEGKYMVMMEDSPGELENCCVDFTDVDRKSKLHVTYTTNRENHTGTALKPMEMFLYDNKCIPWTINERTFEPNMFKTTGKFEIDISKIDLKRHGNRIVLLNAHEIEIKTFMSFTYDYHFIENEHYEFENILEEEIFRKHNIKTKFFSPSPPL